MDLPSSRELELEALLRKKDSQLAELTVCPLILPLIPYLLITVPWRCAGRGQRPPPVSLDSAQSISHRAPISAPRAHISAPNPY